MYNRLATALFACLLLTFSATAQPILPPGERPSQPRAPIGGGQTAGLQTVTADEVAGILRENGLQQVETTKFKDQPGVIVRGWRGFNVGIVFFGCEAGGCLWFRIVTMGKAPSYMNLPYVNDWNERMSFTKLVLDKEKNFFLILDVIAKGGVTRDNVITHLGTYELMLVEFVKGKQQ